MKTEKEIKKEFDDLVKITKELQSIGFIAYIEIGNTVEPFLLKVKNKRFSILKVT